VSGSRAVGLKRRYRLIIFDADGTLRRTTVEGQPCPLAPDQWEYLPGRRDLLDELLAGDIAVAIASNQDRVGFGQLSETDARAMLFDLLGGEGGPATIGAIELCPHRPDEGCGCRKPEPGMLRRLIYHFGASPDVTLFVGDADTDAEAARRAGVDFRWADEFFDQSASGACSEALGA
jgi:D-glycero-D-manno-heptose 1,7-bisphosphate phosphatase